MTTRRYREAVSPALRRVLIVVLVLFAVLVADSAYLGTITFLEWFRGISLQGAVYQYVFLAHLALGFLLIPPALVYSIGHLRRALNRPNRLAVRLGLALFVTTLLLLGSGVLLTRGLPLFEVRHPDTRMLIYWLHVGTPFVAAWLFVLHRLAGKPIRWASGAAILSLSVLISLAGAWLSRPPPPAVIPGDFTPSLARTANGGLIEASALMNDQYCAACHEDIHTQWQTSAHHLASFNNPAYLFSVRNTRKVAFERDGDVRAARFCAGCHDPVPLFSGAFDEPDFDDVSHPTAHAGITCSACHSITAISSPRGNGDYVIEASEHYPFAFAGSPALRFVNHLLIKGKPALHKRTFLKPLHETAEFCGTCHKVHLPETLNRYKWLRGQNHYDSFLLSGVSGHGITSFYYPDQAESNCNGCHMPLTPSADFGAAPAHDGTLSVHGHNFPGANTALAHLLNLPDEVNDAHRKILEGSLRVDIFGLIEGDDIDGDLIAPLDPGGTRFNLKAGQTYVLVVVLRTLTLGHLFTEGTADSNEVWLDVSLKDAEGNHATSGSRSDEDGAVDPWSHFVNAYVIDRDGQRIARRNAEDIFTKLYDHQIPPGAADVVYYRFQAHNSSPVSLSVALRYRKFDTTFMRAFQGSTFTSNTLPIVTIADTRLQLGGSTPAAHPPDAMAAPAVSMAVPAVSMAVPAWQRWNDYGIGLLRKPGRGALRQAEKAFRQVAELGRAEGPLNLARLYLREGRLDEAATQLGIAQERGAWPWSVAWFSAEVNLQNGEFDAAINSLTGILDTRFVAARERGFDFSRDYRIHNKLAQALFDRAKLGRTENESAGFLSRAISAYKSALALDPENVTAHYGLTQVYELQGEREQAATHRGLHERYRVDDNAHDRAVAIARKADPAANHAAEALVIYDLQRASNVNASKPDD